MSTAPQRGFPDTEFAARCAAAQAAMARRGIDAMLFASEAEIRYFTGFLTPFWQSPTRPWFVVLPLTGRPVAVIPTIGVPLMSQCYVDDVVSWASPAPQDDGVSLLAGTIRKIIGGTGTLGVLMGRETAMRMPLADVMGLRASLDGIGWTDMTADIQAIRMVKSDRETAKIRYVCELAEDAFDAVPEWVSAGMPLDQLFRDFKRDALGRGVDDVSYLVGAAGAGGYQDIIAPPSTRPLANGDILMLDTGCVWDGYFCDFDRNYAIGTPSAAAQQAHHRLYDATDAALEMLRPGITPQDLFVTMDRILRPQGAAQGGGDDVGRYGHGLGIQLTEPPSHTDWDETDIVAGMVLTIEPSLVYNDDRLMVAEENVLVTPDGATLLTRRAPRDLPVIG